MWGGVYASDSCVALYYPEINPPYRAIFDEITLGIKYSADIEVKTITFKESSPQDNIQQPCDIAIGLGRAGVGYLDKYGLKIKRIYGAILSDPYSISAIPTISLVPSPMAMFERAQYFMPELSTVHVVYNPSVNQNYINSAIEQAKTLNIQLVTHSAKDIKHAVKSYQEILSNIVSEKEALWLLQDSSIADSKAVLANILKMAWRKRLVVFSNQPGHAKRGVLFSVYADNYALGVALGKLAASCSSTKCAEGGTQALLSLRTAINVRTAARLGISTNSMKHKFIDLTFPRR